MELVLSPAACWARTQHATWQAKLRAYVRLLLASGTRPTVTSELTAALQASEEELLAYLLAGRTVTRAARQQAQAFLDMAQHDLLSSPLDMRLLAAPALGSLLPDEWPTLRDY